MEKKKNELPNHLERNLLIGMMIFWVLVLIGLLGGYIYMLLPSHPSTLLPTASAIEATNRYVGTALAQTEAAQTMMTGTAVP